MLKNVTRGSNHQLKSRHFGCHPLLDHLLLLVLPTSNLLIMHCCAFFDIDILARIQLRKVDLDSPSLVGPKRYAFLLATNEFHPS
jgi:hypothetical protein